MAVIYANLIELGLRVLENPLNNEIAVPNIWKEATREELIKRGYFN